MKISGKFILKVAGTLTIISLVVALLLGLVNGVTADKIAAMNAAATQTALEAVTEAFRKPPSMLISPNSFSMSTSFSP